MNGYLTRAQVAQQFPISFSYLEKAGMAKPPFPGPRVIRIGTKVLYRETDIRDWLDSRVQGPGEHRPPAPSPIKRGPGRPPKVAPTQKKGS